MHWAPYALGDPELLAAMFAGAGLPRAEIRTYVGKACFPSIRSWMHTDVRGWTLADKLDDAEFELLVTEAEDALKPFVAADGSVSFDAPAHIVTAGG